MNKRASVFEEDGCQSEDNLGIGEFQFEDLFLVTDFGFGDSGDVPCDNSIEFWSKMEYHVGGYEWVPEEYFGRTHCRAFG